MTIQERMNQIMDRNGLDINQGARLFGVNPGTYRKWINDTRRPNDCVIRLLFVLEQLELFSPDMFSIMVNEVKL